MKNRVCALYRVSTDKQVDHNDKNQADIPMQRKACHAFCDKMGWTIVHEEQEEGVSGHKVRAEKAQCSTLSIQISRCAASAILKIPSSGRCRKDAARRHIAGERCQQNLFQMAGDGGVPALRERCADFVPVHHEGRTMFRHSVPPPKKHDS